LTNAKKYRFAPSPDPSPWALLGAWLLSRLSDRRSPTHEITWIDVTARSPVLTGYSKQTAHGDSLQSVSQSACHSLVAIWRLWTYVVDGRLISNATPNTPPHTSCCPSLHNHWRGGVDSGKLTVLTWPAWLRCSCVSISSENVKVQLDELLLIQTPLPPHRWQRSLYKTYSFHFWPLSRLISLTVSDARIINVQSHSIW